MLKNLIVSVKDSELNVVVPKKISEDSFPLLVKKAVWNFYSERAEEEVERVLKSLFKKARDRASGF